MKKIILLATMSVLFISSTALSCNSENATCDIDSAAFSEILNYTCSNGRTYITSNGAINIARAVAQNKIDLTTYKTIFRNTCSTDTAMEVAEGDKNGTISADAFSDTYGYTCSNGRTYITSSGALNVARSVAQNIIDLATYKTIFRSTCSTDTAMEVAEGDKNGTLSADAFKEVYGYTCSNGRTYITSSGALNVARGVAQNNLNLATYKTVFRSTCSTDTAMEVACN